MTQSDEKMTVGTHEEALMAEVYPKIRQHPDILEHLLKEAVHRLARQMETQDEFALEEEATELTFDIEPELVRLAEVVMKANNLPVTKLPKMLLLLLEGYADWRYEDMRVYIKKQILD